MFIITKKQIRPNTSVDFFTMSAFVNDRAELKQHFFLTYMSTGKLIGSEDTLSADTLEKITETRWQSEDAFNQWKSDPICAEMVAGHIEYCVQNNITNTTESTQTV